MCKWIKYIWLNHSYIWVIPCQNTKKKVDHLWSFSNFNMLKFRSFYDQLPIFSAKYWFLGILCHFEKNFFSDVSWPVNFLKNRVTLTRFFSGVLRASENLKYVLESLINTLSNYIKRFWNYLSFCPNTGCFLKHVYFTYHL